MSFGLAGDIFARGSDFSGKTADITAPVFQSASISANGGSISITYNEPVTFGVGGNTGYTISASGGASTLSYSSGDTTSTLVYALSRTIEYGETVTISYTNPGDGVEDLAGNDAANLTSESVTNSSSVGQPLSGSRLHIGIGIHI